MSLRAEIGDLRLRFAILRLGGGQRIFDRRELAAQGGDLLVQYVDLRHSAGGDLFFRGELLLGAALSRGSALARRELGFELGLVLLRRFERRGESGELIVGIGLAGPLQSQERGQFVDLLMQLGEHRVLAGDFAGEEELRQHEDREKEGDGEQHGRQGIDEARPIIDMAGLPSGPRQGHQRRSVSEASRFKIALSSLL